MNNLDRLRAIAMAYPGAWEDTPWGDVVWKVGKKVFLFTGPSGEGITVKPEPEEREALLASGRATVAHYIGRYGWVSVDLTAKKQDWAEITELIDTTYRAVAPKKLVRELDAR